MNCPMCKGTKTTVFCTPITKLQKDGSIKMLDDFKYWVLCKRGCVQTFRHKTKKEAVAAWEKGIVR